MSMNVSFFPNPDYEAKMYADKNGISLDKAKSELKTKYGDPDTSVFAGGGSDTFTPSSKIPSAHTIEADNEVQNYASHNNVTLSEAREALRNLFGNPDGYDGADGNTSTGSSSGSDSHPVATDADNTVQEYASHNGVSTDAAREALRNIFGDPVGYEGADSSSSGGSSSSSSTDNNPFAHIVEADNEVLTYARMHNCSLDEARAALMGIFGNPQ